MIIFNGKLNLHTWILLLN